MPKPGESFTTSRVRETRLPYLFKSNTPSIYEVGFKIETLRCHLDLRPGNLEAWIKSEEPCAKYTPPKTNLDTQNSHIWKEVHLKNHRFWYLCWISGKYLSIINILTVYQTWMLKQKTTSSSLETRHCRFSALFGEWNSFFPSAFHQTVELIEAFETRISSNFPLQ